MSPKPGGLHERAKGSSHGRKATPSAESAAG
jgi:hypothetical protein